MSTIKDIAKYTGLSIATVSKYINGGNVQECNAVLIAEAISVLDYRVNLAARALKTHRTMIVGVLLPMLTTPFFSSICAVIEGYLKKEGYSIIVCGYYDDPKEEMEKLRFLINQNVDGILLVPQFISAGEINEIKEIREHKIPFVLMDRYIQDYECDRVLVDNSSATYGAVEQFIINGHRRIGIIIGPPDISTAYERRLGYERVHQDYSIPIDSSLICVGDYSIGSGYKAMSELMDMTEPPTAVIGTNHEMTMGAITLAYERNLHIPNDISFIGYDEIQLTRIMNPPITVVMQPIAEIAKYTAEILAMRLRGDDSSYPQVYRLKTELLVHESIRNLKNGFVSVTNEGAAYISRGAHCVSANK